MTRAAPMAGGGAYNRNSSIQATGLLPGVELLRQAATAAIGRSFYDRLLPPDSVTLKGHVE